MFPERPARSTPPTPWVPEGPLQTQRNVPAIPPSFNLDDNLDVEVDSVYAAYTRDLDVHLVSTRGRIQWVSKRAGGAANHLDVRNRDYTSHYRGHVANGTWRLRMRDAAPRDRATYRRFSLALTAPRG